MISSSIVGKDRKMLAYSVRCCSITMPMQQGEKRANRNDFDKLSTLQCDGMENVANDVDTGNVR